MVPNAMYMNSYSFSSGAGIIIQNRKSVFLIASALFIVFLLSKMSKCKNGNNTGPISQVLSSDNKELINDGTLVQIIDYDVLKHKEAVKSIVEQGPNKLDATDSSPEQKIEAIMNDLAKNITKILINNNNDPVGFINFGLTGHILLLAVDNHHQRKGYGEMLMKYALVELNRLTPTPTITIDVWRNNIPAKSLYQKLHFTFTPHNLWAGVDHGTLTADQKVSDGGLTNCWPCNII